MDIYDRYNDRIGNAWKGGVFDEDGNEVHSQVLPDRAAVSVPLMMMDGKALPRQVHTLPLSDAEREQRRKLYDGYRQRISNLWQNPDEVWK